MIFSLNYRQMVARNLLDTLRAIFTNHEDLEEGLKVLVCLSEDIGNDNIL